MPVNVSDYLRAAAQRDPDGVAIVEVPEGRQVSWSQFDAHADAFAQSLLGMGLVAGHRVALVMANGIDFAIAWFGAVRGGLVVVPMNPRSVPDELSRMIADSAPRVVVADAGSVAQLRLADVGETAVVVQGEEPRDGELPFSKLLGEASTLEPVAPLDPESAAAILYTSGATGRPRGAILTHRALIANLEQVGRLPRPAVTADDVVLGLLPMFHIYGLNAILGQCVRVGATLVTVERFDADGLLDVIVARGITNLPIAPPVIAAWADHEGAREALAGVRVVISGSAPLDADLLEEFERTTGRRVEQGYGLTEAAPVVLTTLALEQDGAAPRGSVGTAVPDMEVQVRDHLGQQAQPGDPGELWVRGDNLFSGYWPDGDGGPDADGWYGTGDVGIVDETGHITLVDRVRELVIVSGFNVYPSEVEEIIAALPEVSEVAVVGVPDVRTGEKVLAYVVPADPDADRDAIAELVVAHCRERIARFKVPSNVIVVGDLVRSATGKIQKGRLRALARGLELNL